MILLLGGARSGKSRYAEEWARERGGRVLFVATAQAFDGEMRARIARHRADRPASWATLEAPLGVAAALRAAYPGGLPFDTVLVDCLTLLAANVLLALPEDAPQEQVERAVLEETGALLDLAAEGNAENSTEDSAAGGPTWLIVSNEVGMGVVPPTRLGRFYRDALGRANQRAAAAADEVLLLVAGIAWKLK